MAKKTSTKKCKPTTSHDAGKPTRQFESRAFEEAPGDTPLTQAEVDKVGFTAPDMTAGIAEEEKETLQGKGDPEEANLEDEIVDKSQKAVQEENQVATEAQQDEEIRTKLADETETTVEHQADAKDTEEDVAKAENKLAHKQEQKVKEMN
ncbi:hypothetical protein C7293_26660 [filamentous cyanobacterium CCT1]|nr:hypothetical protein C7293_26660 [filamentous cyanobacterium CCT1]